MTEPVARTHPPDPPPLPSPSEPPSPSRRPTPESVLADAGALADRSDADLLAAHVDGDPTAFAVLVTRHRDRLWAIALRTMRNPEDAADALQDAYIAAFRRAGSFRGDSRVTTWLHRVVVDACLDRLRRNKVRATDPLPTDPDRSAELADAEDPDDPIEAQEQAAEVATALGRLNPDQRAALVLVDMEGYSVEEAAVILGCAAGTVKSRCARGRAKLAPMLSHLRLVGDPEDPGDAGDSGGSGGSGSGSGGRRPPTPSIGRSAGGRRPRVPTGTDPPPTTPTAPTARLARLLSRHRPLRLELIAC